MPQPMRFLSEAAPAFDARAIMILRGPEAVRERAGLYIGNLHDGSGLHRMIYEAVDNAIHEIVNGQADRAEVTLNADGSATVLHNGRTIPIDIQPEVDVDAADLARIRLRAGNKLGEGRRCNLGGLHGIGICVVNALSEWLDLRIWRDGQEWRMRFRSGVPEAPLEAVGPQGNRRGTEVTFLPSTDTFTRIEFDVDAIEHRLRGLAFLNRGARIVLSDTRGVDSKRIELHYEADAHEALTGVLSVKVRNPELL